MLFNIYQRPLLFFTSFILIFSIVHGIFPDIMPFNQGFGFEGYTIYKPLAENLHRYLLEERMNSYSIQRIFPYVLLHTTFKTLGITFTDVHMIQFFRAFHLGLALLIIITWDRLAIHLQLKLAGQWIGYLSMLVNFATLKHDFYIPFTYDRLALASGLLSLYCYFTDRPLALLLNALLSLIIWPTALFFNLIMLLVPANESVPSTHNLWLGRVWATVLTVAVGGMFLLFIYVERIPDSKNLAPIIRPLLPLSLLLAAGYIAYTQASLAQLLFPGWREIGPKLAQVLCPKQAWIYAVVLLVSYFWLTRILGDPSNPYLTPQKFATNITYGALQRPAQFLICHAVYYGLPVLMLGLFWQRALRAITHLGLGTGLMLLAVMMQAVNNETRQLANVLPLLALVAALIADNLKPQPVTVAITAFVAFILSKGWLPLNYFNPTRGQPYDIFPMRNFEDQAFLSWPQQVYFMNFGPWTSTRFLAIQAIVLLLAAALLHWLWVRRINQRTALNS